MVYKFFDKKTGSGDSVNNQLAEELHKPVTKKFKRTKVYGQQIQPKWNHFFQMIKVLNIY